jgi:hypothetical protein
VRRTSRRGLRYATIRHCLQQRSWLDMTILSLLTLPQLGHAARDASRRAEDFAGDS